MEARIKADEQAAAAAPAPVAKTLENLRFNADYEKNPGKRPTSLFKAVRTRAVEEQKSAAAAEPARISAEEEQEAETTAETARIKAEEEATAATAAATEEACGKVEEEPIACAARWKRRQ